MSSDPLDREAMLNLSVGVDSVSIPRMEQSLARESFCARVFSPQERAYFAEKHHPAQSAAGHFAAKEAFLKAMGTGITTLDLQAVEVAHDSEGAPYFVLTGWAAELGGGHRLALSITHEAGLATAFVVSYGE